MILAKLVYRFIWKVLNTEYKHCIIKECYYTEIDFDLKFSNFPIVIT